MTGASQNITYPSSAGAGQSLSPSPREARVGRDFAETKFRALNPGTGARLCEPQPAPDSKAFPLVLSTIGLAKLLRVADPRSVRFMERGA